MVHIRLEPAQHADAIQLNFQSEIFGDKGDKQLLYPLMHSINTANNLLIVTMADLHGRPLPNQIRLRIDEKESGASHGLSPQDWAARERTPPPRGSGP